MKTVNIGTLKNQLSAYLKYVQNGEEVVVRDRKKPVARILPIRALNLSDEEEQLVAAGILKLSKNELEGKEMDWDAFWALPMPEVSDEAAHEAIMWAKGYEKDEM
ncbi:MAG: type II toxin-antitoxin system Phd/YefM family antitoxin [Terracidiphilus sp.]